jgi:hypothetical protein
MKHPTDILPSHRQLHPGSCIGWGLDLLVKMYEKESAQRESFQSRCRNGSGLADEWVEELRGRYGISLRSQSFKDDFSSFERAAIPEIHKGFYPLLTFPSFVAFDLEQERIVEACHTWVVTTDPYGEVRFHTQRHDCDKVFTIPKHAMTDAHHLWGRRYNFAIAAPGSLLNAFFHSPVVQAKTPP